jgi:5-methylcytosine-specific restriction protein A
MNRPKSKQRPWSRKTAAPAPMAQRVRVEFYHTSRWKKESAQFRALHPLCIRCEAEGIIYPSEVTDHRIPLEICEDPWDRDNWDALCNRHNNKKAASDKKLIKQHRKTNRK